ncbi:MAG TPA: DinB family protein [Bryobacteraceae bacterium]
MVLATEKESLMGLQCISFQIDIRAVRNLFQRYLTETVALLLAALAGTASAQSLTPADRDRALQYLESTKKNILEATAGLSQAQWNFKPTPDRWSIAQVMEHIAASEDFIREKLLKDKVMIAPPGKPGRDVRQIDQAVVTMIPDRTHKAQAPEPLVPTNRFGSPNGSLKHFVESRAATEQFLRTATGLRDHVMNGPVGRMDGYEFILFIAAHSERHTKQINELKADPNFPKN